MNENNFETPALESKETVRITIKPVIGLEGAESSSTLWCGRQAKNGKSVRRDLRLSAALPVISAESIAMLAQLEPAKLAELLNQCLVEQVKTAKCNKLGFGADKLSSIELILPASGSLNLAATALTWAVDTQRVAKELTATNVKNALASADYKLALAKYLSVKNIPEKTWISNVVNELILPCTSQDYSIGESRVGMSARAIVHIMAIRDMIQGNNPVAARTLELVCGAIDAAPSHDDSIGSI